MVGVLTETIILTGANRRDFSGMIHWLTIIFFIPATPNPSSNPTDLAPVSHQGFLHVWSEVMGKSSKQELSFSPLLCLVGLLDGLGVAGITIDSCCQKWWIIPENSLLTKHQ
jgi:hypothetical protein